MTVLGLNCPVSVRIRHWITLWYTAERHIFELLHMRDCEHNRKKNQTIKPQCKIHILWHIISLTSKIYTTDILDSWYNVILYNDNWYSWYDNTMTIDRQVSLMTYLLRSLCCAFWSLSFSLFSFLSLSPPLQVSVYCLGNKFIYPLVTSLPTEISHFSTAKNQGIFLMNPS